MEIIFGVKYDELNEDMTRASDGIVRYLSRSFPEATWKKEDGLWKLLI